MDAMGEMVAVIQSLGGSLWGLYGHSNNGLFVCSNAWEIWHCVGLEMSF
jgi:hypothetical protein